MRVDMLLNKLCFVKTRSIAKNACDKNLVKINGKAAKASTELKGGEEIDFSLSGFRTIFTLKDIPAGNVSKKDAPEFYSITSREKLPEMTE